MLRTFLFCATLAAIPQFASAALVNVDFNAGDNGNGADPGVTATGAAAIGSAGDQWNGAQTQSSVSPQSLFDSTGAPTSLTLSWSASASWNIASNNSPNPNLTNDFLFASDVNIANVPKGRYNLYLYASDDVNQSGARSTSFTVNGGTAQNVVQFSDPTHWDDAATDPNNHGNYTLFSNISPVGGVFDITLGGTTTINGFQLVAIVPEPSSVIALLGLCGMGLIALRWRRRTAPKN